MGVDLGTRLQHAGLLTRESLERLLAVLDRSSRSFVDVLLAADEVDEDALVGFFVAEGYGPLVGAGALVARGVGPPRLPREMCEALAALPFADDGDAVAVAMADPSDMHALAEVQRALGRPVRPHVARASDLRRAIEDAYTVQTPAVAPLPAPRRVGDPADATEEAPVIVELVQRRIPEAQRVSKEPADPSRASEGLGGLKVATRPIPLVHPTERRSAVPGLLVDADADAADDDGQPIALTHRKTPPPAIDDAPIELTRPSRASFSRDAPTLPPTRDRPPPAVPPAPATFPPHRDRPSVSRDAETLPPSRHRPSISRDAATLPPSQPDYARASEPGAARPAITPARPFTTTLRSSGPMLGPPAPPKPPTSRPLRSTLIGNPSDSTPPSAPTSTAGVSPTASALRPSAEPAPPTTGEMPPASFEPRATKAASAAAHPPTPPTSFEPPVATGASAPVHTPTPPAPPDRDPPPNPAGVIAPATRQRAASYSPPRRPSAMPPKALSPTPLPPKRRGRSSSGEHWVLPPAGPFPARDQLARPPEPSPARVDLRRTDPDIARASSTGDLGSLLAVMRTARDRDSVVAAALEALMTTARRAIFLVVKRDVLQGWDGRGPLISTDALRNLWIPVSSPSVFRDIVEAGAVYRGPAGTTTADAIFLTAVAGRPEEVILQPVVVRGRVVGVLYCEDPAYGRAASERAEVIARACCDAFERIILTAR